MSETESQTIYSYIFFLVHRWGYGGKGVVDS